MTQREAKEKNQKQTLVNVQTCYCLTPATYMQTQTDWLDGAAGGCRLAQTCYRIHSVISHVHKAEN